MSALDTFCAVHVSGLLIPNRSTVTALALLFDKIYLPAHIEPVKSFAQRYKIISDTDELPEIAITSADGAETDPFLNLDSEQRKTALRYIDWSIRFSLDYAGLFDDVF